jgi:hypothetical protein
MDADLASDVADLPTLLAALDHAEVALGSRRLGGGAERSAKRRLGSWVFHQMTRMFVPLDLADTQCGFKAFRHTEAKVIFGLSQVAGFAFDIEVLAIARSLGYRIAEVPVRWTEQPHGTFNALRHTPAMLADVVRARRNVHRAVRHAGLAPAGAPRLVQPRGQLSGFATAHEVALAQATAGPPHKPHANGLVERPAPTRRPGLGVDVATRVDPPTRRPRDRPDQPGRPPPDEPNPTSTRRPAGERSGGASDSRTGPPGDAAPAGLPTRTSLPHLLWIALGYAALFLLQAPGKLTADTKIELAVAPTRFLADATHLWNSPIRLDGWQQGWIVPAGAGGTGVLENRPGQTYQAGLVVGFALVAVLLAVALVPGRRRRRHRAARLDGGARLVTGTRWWERLPAWWVAMVAGTVAVGLVAGPVALVVPALAVVARRWPGLLPWAAAAAMAAAGVAMLATPDRTPREGVGASGGFAQAAGATALAAVLVALCVGRDSRPDSRAGP